MPHASKKGQEGFTIIEILAVIAIMSVLAGLILAAAVGAHRKADSDAAAAGIQLIANQIEAYANKRGEYNFPDTNGNGVVSENEIYSVLSEWGFSVPAARRMDPWGNPFVVVLLQNYNDNFDLQNGPYLLPPYDRMHQMYGSPGAPEPKEIHQGDPATTDAYNDQANGFQVISAGPDGLLNRNGLADVNADNFSNW